MTERPDDSRVTDRFSRRHFIAASAATTAGLAGCLSGDDSADDDDGDDQDDSNGDQPAFGPGSQVLEDPPARVYLPSHREAFEFLPMERAGDYMLMPHFTYAHQFWLVSDQETVDPIEPENQELHFMFSFWDAETGKMLPANVTGPMELRKDGETVDGPRRPWPMIAQGMGFHFGDNLQFATDDYDLPQPEGGTYEIDLELRPIPVRTTGEFAGRFEETVSTTIEFEFDPETLVRINDEIEFFDEDRWGDPEAVPLMDHDHGGMDHDEEHEDGHGDHEDGHGDHEDSDGHDNGHGDHEHPEMALPQAEGYPGETLGMADGELPSSHDARFVVQYLEDSRLAQDGSNYLLVSPRTPYNRIPLPEMSLSVDGDIEGDLTETLDSELGHHYGMTVDLPADATFDLVVDSPPQVSRHRGYQTAFLDMPPMTIER